MANVKYPRTVRFPLEAMVTTEADQGSSSGDTTQGSASSVGMYYTDLSQSANWIVGSILPGHGGGWSGTSGITYGKHVFHPPFNVRNTLDASNCDPELTVTSGFPPNQWQQKITPNAYGGYVAIWAVRYSDASHTYDVPLISNYSEGIDPSKVTMFSPPYPWIHPPDTAFWGESASERHDSVTIGRPPLTDVLQPGEFYVSARIVVALWQNQTITDPDNILNRYPSPTAAVILGPPDIAPPTWPASKDQLIAYATRPAPGARIPFSSLPMNESGDYPPTRWLKRERRIDVDRLETNPGPGVRLTADLGNAPLPVVSYTAYVYSGYYPPLYALWRQQDVTVRCWSMTAWIDLDPKRTYLEVVIDKRGAETAKPPKNVYHRAYQDLADRRRG